MNTASIDCYVTPQIIYTYIIISWASPALLHFLQLCPRRDEFQKKVLNFSTASTSNLPPSKKELRDTIS